MVAVPAVDATAPRSPRRRGRWLPPRGVHRDGSSREFNRVYEPDARQRWLREPDDCPTGPGPLTAGLAPSAAPPSVGARPSSTRPLLGGTSGRVRTAGDAPLAEVVREPARWWLRHQHRVIAMDCAVVVLAVLLGAAISSLGRPWDVAPDQPVTSYSTPTLWALGIASVWLVLISVSELWSVGAMRSGQATTRPLVRSASAVFVAVGVVAYFTGDERLRIFLLLSVPLGLVGLLAVRALARRHIRAMRSSGMLPGLVLVAGHDEQLGRALAVWLRDSWGAAITVTVGEGGPADTAADGSHESAVRQLRAQVRSAGADLLVLARPETWTPAEIGGLAWNASQVGTDLMVPAPSAGGRVVSPPVAAARLVGGHAPRDGVPDLGLIAVDPRRPRSVRAARAVIDWLIAATATVLLAPFVLLAAIVVAVVQAPPVFIENERMGRDGEVFLVWTFRCLAHAGGGGAGDVRSGDGSSPGMSWIARLVRRTGLEDVPGLLNVLTGDLALIGPRPQLPGVGYQPSATPWLRPGLTGRWRDPGLVDLPERDGEYLWRDLRVLARLVGRRLGGPPPHTP